MEHPGKHPTWFKQWLEVCPRVVGSIELVAGSMALGGAMAGVPVLSGQWGSIAPMDGGVALSLIIFGAVFMLRAGGRDAPSRWPLVALGLPLFYGLAALFMHATGQAEAHTVATIYQGWPPSHISLFSAAGLVLVSVSLALVGGRRWAVWGQVLAAFVGLFALHLVLSYGYVMDYARIPHLFRDVGLLEALCLLVLAPGMLCVNHNAGFMVTITSQTEGGLLARRLLPVAVLAPVFLGFVRHLGQESSLYGTGFGLALFTVVNVAVVGLVVIWNSRQLMLTDTRRNEAQENLRASTKRLQEAQRVAKLGWFDWDLATGETFWSDDIFVILGVNPATTRPSLEFWLELTHAADRDAVRAGVKAALEGQKLLMVETRVNRPDGRMIHVHTRGEVVRDDAGKPLRIEGTIQDISDRVRLQLQLNQSQKMEGIGRLAGGVAHDFNNLLTAILGYTDMALAKAEPGTPLHKHLGHVRHSGERAAALTQQLLAFARKQIVEPKVISVNDTLLGMDKILRRVIGEDIEIVTLPAKDIWRTRIDPSQFEQIVMNLAVNARDAMPGGGKLTLETGNVALDAGYCASRPDVQTGEYVLLAVTDTGTGISDAAKSHIFEPFFTTKERGKGTGLGLATVFGIVKQAGGHIAVYSEQGRGTTFKVYLPRTSEIASTSHATGDLDKVRGGDETILIVEDEPLVRSLVSETLRSQGYAVLEAANGEEALRIAGAHDGDIHLMITDVIMPQMGGKQLAQQMAIKRPKMAVLYISGYTENAIVHQGVLDTGVSFLHKPFTHAGLSRKVRDLLDAHFGTRNGKS